MPNTAFLASGVNMTITGRSLVLITQQVTKFLYPHIVQKSLQQQFQHKDGNLTTVLK